MLRQRHLYIIEGFNASGKDTIEQAITSILHQETSKAHDLINKLFLRYRGTSRIKNEDVDYKIDVIESGVLYELNCENKETRVFTGYTDVARLLRIITDNHKNSNHFSTSCKALRLTNHNVSYMLHDEEDWVVMGDVTGPLYDVVSIEGKRNSYGWNVDVSYAPQGSTITYTVRE